MKRILTIVTLLGALCACENQATLFVGEATYEMVKDEPLALADESYMFFEGKDRMGLYNQIHDEIEQRGMFER